MSDHKTDAAKTGAHKAGDAKAADPKSAGAKPADVKPTDAPKAGEEPKAAESPPSTGDGVGPGGRSHSELDARRNEGSDPALLANKLIPRTDAAPAVVAEEPTERTAKDFKWADDLVAALAETGTGADKLAVIQRAKVVKFELGENYGLPESDPNFNKRTELAKDHRHRHLTAEEACRALEAAPEVGPVTRQKARAFLKHGKWAPAPVSTPALDAHVPPPPSDDHPADDVYGAEADDKPKAAKKGRAKSAHHDEE